MDSTKLLLPRQSTPPGEPPLQPVQGGAGGNTFVNLISNPFSSELNSTSFFASLAWTLGLSLILVVLFCFLRPRTNAVYAPRAKHADAKHAPPRLDNGFTSWIGPIKNVKEHELMEKIGMDAVVFLRFMKMLRNIFMVLTVLGLGIILPVNLVHNSSGPPPPSPGPSKRQAPPPPPSVDVSKISLFIQFTPQFGQGSKFWAYTICAYIFDGVICFFIWWNYRKVVQLRRKYLQSHEYLSSLHSRTLMVSEK
ncbi:MAG: hypothetical protein Q9162_002485 [Coniocarpon cinnabarinum]